MLDVSPETKFTLAWATYKRDIRAWSWSRWRGLPGYVLEDLEAEMAAVLWRAVQTYDPHNGSKFANYFRTLRDRKYADLLRRAGAIQRQSEDGWIEIDRDALRDMITAPSSEDEVLARIDLHEAMIARGYTESREISA